MNILLTCSVFMCASNVQNPESRYSPAQKAVVLVFSRSLDGGTEKGQGSGSNKGSSVTARLVVPSNQVGCLMGKGGVIVSEIRKVTGASIRVVGGNQVPKCVSEKNEVVLVWTIWSFLLPWFREIYYFACSNSPGGELLVGRAQQTEFTQDGFIMFIFRSMKRNFEL